MMQVYSGVVQLLQQLEASPGPIGPADFTECVAILNQAIQRHPTQVSYILTQLLNIFSGMLAQRQQFCLSDYADFYSLTFEAFSALPAGSHDFNEQILTAAVLALSNISDQVDEAWAVSDEGEVQCLEIRVCREIMEVVEEFASKATPKISRAYFTPIFIKYTQFSNDWREKYGALTVAVQLMDQIEQLSEGKPFIETALAELHNTHPKMRFIALDLLGEASQSLQPVIQEEYFEAIVPEVLKLLYNNPPRIVCKAFACLTNFFFEFHHFWKVEGVMNDLLTPVIQYLKEGSPYIQQCVLNVINSLGAIRGCLGASAGMLVQACAQFLQQQQRFNNTEMLGEAFNSLAILLCEQNQQAVGQYIPHFIDSLLANHHKISGESFLEAWSRLCLEFKKFVDLQATSVIRLITQKIKKILEQQQIEDTSLQALDALSHTFTAFQEGIRPYMKQLFQFCKGICQNEQYQIPVRNKGLDLIVDVLLTNRPQGQRDKQFIDQAMSVLQFLIAKGDESISSQGNARLLQGALEGIEGLIEPLGHTLSKHTITHLSDRLLSYKQYIQETTSQKAGEDVIADDEEEDGSYENISEDDPELENDLFEIASIIPDIYAKLLIASQHSEKQMLISILIPQISFSVGKEDRWKEFALNLAISLVQGCSYDDLSAYWGDLMSLFTGFITHKSTNLRIPSVYGCGVIFEKTPFNFVSAENITTWLEALCNCASSPFNEEDEKTSIGYCKDNVIAALGKLLKNYGLHYPLVLTPKVYLKWLQHLPLKFDKEEQGKQIQILLQMLATNPNPFLSEQQSLKLVLEALASYYLLHSHEKQKETLMKVKECFGKITQWEPFQRSSQFLWSSLSANHRTALTKLMALL